MIHLDTARYQDWLHYPLASLSSTVTIKVISVSVVLLDKIAENKNIWWPQYVSKFKVIIVQCLTVKFSPQIFVLCQIFHLLFAQIHIWSFLQCTTMSIKFRNTIWHFLIFQARKKQLELAASQQSMWCRFRNSDGARNCQTQLSDDRAAAGGWRSSTSVSAQKYK